MLASAMKNSSAILLLCLLGLGCRPHPNVDSVFREHEKIIAKLTLEKAELEARLSLIAKELAESSAKAELNHKEEIQNAQRELLVLARKLETEKHSKNTLEVELDKLRKERSRLEAEVSSAREALVRISSEELRSFKECELTVIEQNLPKALRAFKAHLLSYPAGETSGSVKDQIQKLQQRIEAAELERIRSGKVGFEEWGALLSGLDRETIEAKLGPPTSTRKVSMVGDSMEEVAVYPSLVEGKNLEILYWGRKVEVLTPRKPSEWAHFFNDQAPNLDIIDVFGSPSADSTDSEQGRTLIFDGRCPGKIRLRIRFPPNLGRLFDASY